MNLLDAYVTEILGEPKYNDDFEVSCWIVKVKYNSYGVIGEWGLTFDTEEDAKKLSVGCHFLI